MKIDANLILREQGANALRNVIDNAVPFKSAARTYPDNPEPDLEGEQRQDMPKIEIATLPPLTVAQWRKRILPALILLMGAWLTTTTRALITAATGLGKTNFGLALAMHAAAGLDFLHWKAHRAVRVLYIDGEMSRRLLRERVLAEAQRIGADPEGFFALSHQDVPGGMKALNTPEGQAWVDAFIKKIGGVDLVIFDNIMSLTTGDQKESEPWRQTLPWSLSLTKSDIGQVWIHHTGHDESRSYGDKTREWQMDAVVHLNSVERDDTDISFAMKFEKARERTPTNRDDFQDVKIALVNDQWEYELSRAQRPDKISPQAARALDALRNVIAGDRATPLPGGGARPRLPTGKPSVFCWASSTPRPSRTVRAPCSPNTAASSSAPSASAAKGIFHGSSDRPRNRRNRRATEPQPAPKTMVADPPLQPSRNHAARNLRNHRATTVQQGATEPQPADFQPPQPRNHPLKGRQMVAPLYPQPALSLWRLRLRLRAPPLRAGRNWRGPAAGQMAAKSSPSAAVRPGDGAIPIRSRQPSDFGGRVDARAQ
jgi:hypothetical protein